MIPWYSPDAGRRARGAAVLCVLPLLAAPPARALPGRPAVAPEFTVVVHVSNPSRALPREQVARLFLRKVRHWPHGAAAEPVDLAPGAPARYVFTRAVLGKSVSTVRAYWQQRIFSGVDVPPPEKAGDAEVLDFVRTRPAAVAYVSAAATLPPGVRALEVTP